MARTTHLRSLQAIELALRTGSLRSAAEELGITPAALGQRIKALEDYLGYDLLVRSRRGIRPTQELDAVQAHLAAAFRELDTASRLLDFQRVNEIHVAADTDWAELWLKPRLGRFLAQQPNTLFCINGVGDVPVRLGDMDCEVWLGDPRGDGVQDELLQDYLLPVSSPANTKRIGGLEPEDMLEGFPLLHLDGYTAVAGEIGWIEWVNEFGHRKTAPGRGIRYQHAIDALEAVYADAGLMLCGLSLVKAQVEAGELSLPFPVLEGKWTKGSYRVRFRKDSVKREKIAKFREWLIGEAENDQRALRAWVGGT